MIRTAGTGAISNCARLSALTYLLLFLLLKKANPATPANATPYIQPVLAGSGAVVNPQKPGTAVAQSTARLSIVRFMVPPVPAI
jgi:hypothetical protein